MQRAERPFFVSGCSESDLGLIAEIIPERQRVFAPRWACDLAVSDFSAEDHAGLIILGDGKHWATSRCYWRDREWLKRALRKGTPILGICFGAQLLAAHLWKKKRNGKPLAKNRTAEHFGVLAKIAVEEESKTDPVVRHFAGNVPVTQYHEDTFEEPPGATALAWSMSHSYQHCEAFRVGRPEAAV
jgi:GMP synthase-like glutamine amidotransferase